MASVSQLGFLEFEVSDLPRWRAFAVDVLGLAITGEGTDGSVLLSHDGHRIRLVLRQGPADDLHAVGWEVADHGTLEALVHRLGEAGVATRQGTASHARARHAEGVVHLVDPSGVPLELVVGCERMAAPAATPGVPGGFVGDELGLGHVVLTATDRAASERFYFDLLGMKLSDHIICELFGYDVNLTFLHVNPRHHSMALGGALPKRLHHFMLEARELDSVGLILDRVLRAGLPVANLLGRHPNDQMVSFYALSPSGFQFEIGWSGRLIDDASWDPQVYDRISDWGHTPPAVVAPRKKRDRSKA